MNEVRVLWLVLGAAVLGLTACEGKVRLGEPDPDAADGGDAAVVLQGDAAPATTGPADDDGGVGAADEEETDDDEASGEDRRSFSTNRESFGGAPRCEALGALLCDDFESENEGSGPSSDTWKQPFGYLPKIDGSRAARGKKSLHFALSGTTPGHIEQTRTFPATRGRLYGRMFVQFGALPSAPANAHWSLVAAMAGPDSTEVRVGGQQRNDNRFGISSRAPGDDGFDWHTPATEEAAKPVVSTSRWTCLEWYFGADDKETRVWVDGSELASLHLTEDEYRRGDEEGGKRWAFPTLERLRIGWWLYPIENPQPAQIDLWIDEVAIDDARIGCAG